MSAAPSLTAICAARIVHHATRHGVAGAATMALADVGDALHAMRPSTPAARSLACDAWLLADGRAEEVAENLARLDGFDDAAAWSAHVARELAAEDLAPRYRAAAAAHPVTVALVRRLPQLAALIAAGAILTVVDVAVMDERVGAARDQWIAAIEAEGDAPPPPWSSQWDPAHDALATEVA